MIPSAVDEKFLPSLIFEGVAKPAPVVPEAI
jgi:hypothetical protein